MLNYLVLVVFIANFALAVQSMTLTASAELQGAKSNDTAGNKLQILYYLLYFDILIRFFSAVIDKLLRAVTFHLDSSEDISPVD